MAEDRLLIPAPDPYEIVSDSGILAETGAILSAILPTKRVMIVTDDTVAGLYLPALRRSLEKEGFSTSLFIIPCTGEARSPETCLSLIERMAAENIGTEDALLALGGCTVADAVGFSAAIYRNGIRTVLLPTTVTSAVESAIGGDVRLNCAGKKDLIGVKKTPAAVIFDPDTLRTLDEKTFSGGLSLLVRYGMIRDRDLFALLAQGDPLDRAGELCRRAARVRRELLFPQDNSTDGRDLLQFGIGVGDAIALCGGDSIPQGRAAAAGMEIVCRAYEQLGYCESGTTDALCALLERLDLRLKVPYTPEQLFSAALSLLEIRDDRITLISPLRIGGCRALSVPTDTLRLVLEIGTV